MKLFWKSGFRIGYEILADDHHAASVGNLQGDCHVSGRD